MAGCGHTRHRLRGGLRPLMARPQGTRIRRPRGNGGDGGDHTVRMDRRQGLLGWPERGFALLPADRQQGLRRGVPRADKPKLGKLERERAANMPRNGLVPVACSGVACSGGRGSISAKQPSLEQWLGESKIQSERGVSHSPENHCSNRSEFGAATWRRWS